MRQIHGRALLAAYITLVVAGCATLGGPAANQGRFDQDVGVGTLTDVTEKVTKVLRQHAFTIEREETPPTVYYQTYWRNRTPFEDEQALGVVATQNRVIVKGNARSSASTLGMLYGVSVSIENRVQLANGTWSDATATPLYQRYAARIIDDFKRELNIGVRKY